MNSRNNDNTFPWGVGRGIAVTIVAAIVCLVYPPAAHAQSVDLIRMKDGASYAGKVLRRLEKGYLFRSHVGRTVLLKHEAIESVTTGPSSSVSEVESAPARGPGIGTVAFAEEDLQYLGRPTSSPLFEENDQRSADETDARQPTATAGPGVSQQPNPKLNSKDLKYLGKQESQAPNREAEKRKGYWRKDRETDVGFHYMSLFPLGLKADAEDTLPMGGLGLTVRPGLYQVTADIVFREHTYKRGPSMSDDLETSHIVVGLAADFLPLDVRPGIYAGFGIGVYYEYFNADDKDEGKDDHVAELEPGVVVNEQVHSMLFAVGTVVGLTVDPFDVAAKLSYLMNSDKQDIAFIVTAGVEF